MDSVLQTLPPASDLSPVVVSFLDDKFQTEENLSQARALVSELETQCRYLDQNLIDQNRSLGATLVAYASFSDRTHALFGDINVRLIGLGSSTRSHTSTTADGGRGEGNERTEQILGEELPALAKEVARVETVRMYAGEFITQVYQAIAFFDFGIEKQLEFDIGKKFDIVLFQKWNCLKRIENV